MKKAISVGIFALAITGSGSRAMMAQAQTPACGSESYGASSCADVLGAHNNGGRGCAACHSPHTASFGSAEKGAPETGGYSLWGQDANPPYGKTIALSNNGKYTELPPAGSSSPSREVSGILLCLSCHDGQVTPMNMMLNSSYDQWIGLLTNTLSYGRGRLPTLLGNDGAMPSSYTEDHPVGQLAGITTGSGLIFNGTTMVLAPNSPYARFVNNYGYPALAPGKWSQPFGVTASGKPYVLCTTCHNQHTMTMYTSSAASPIARDGGGKYYPTFLFINGPYNPIVNNIGTTSASSTSQFCRQCHFGESNEAHNTFNIATLFQ